MKSYIPIIPLLFAPLAVAHAQSDAVTKTVKTEEVIMAPEQYRRPENWQPQRYPYSLNELKERFSEEMMKQAAGVYADVTKVNEEGKWKPTAESINLHEAPEWFLDAKFGMFIDWGLWSIAGWAPKLKETSAMYPDWYEFKMNREPAFKLYHEKNWGNDFKRDDFFPLFQAREYQPEMLATIARKAGMKYVVPFAKHHSGFCLWPSSYTRRNSMEMGPRRDLIAPLVESCRKEGLKFGFYFSVDEWEYPMIGEDGKIKSRLWMYGEASHNKLDLQESLPVEDLEHLATGKIPVKDFARDYLVPQAVEFIDRYDPDLIWYDGQWSTHVSKAKTHEISAYFYNKAEGRKDVAVNDRYGTEDNKDLRNRRGDFFTSEFHDFHDLKSQQKAYHPWEECRGISQSFGFNWQDTEGNVISPEKFIAMFLDIVSRGGNLLMIVNLDAQGALPEIQKKRLLDIGKWLSINGEGIYGTRMFTTTSEGPVRYTRSKDQQKVYAITTEWPGKALELKSVVPKKGTNVYLLGDPEPLKWTYDASKTLTTIEIPERLQQESARPCQYAYSFRIEPEDAKQ